MYAIEKLTIEPDDTIVGWYRCLDQYGEHDWDFIEVEDEDLDNIPLQALLNMEVVEETRIVNGGIISIGLDTKMLKFALNNQGYNFLVL